MEALGLIGGAFGVILGLVFIIMFIMLCVNVGTIRKNIQSLYSFEHARAMREGLINKDGNIIIKKPALEPSANEAIKNPDTP